MDDNASLRQITDKLAIQAVASEYCLRLEVNAFDDWLDLFTEDTIYEVFRQTLRGRSEVAAMLSQAPHGIHIGGALRIKIVGDSAITVQNYVFIGDDDKFSNNGWYYRTLVRTEAGWKIAHTSVNIQKRTTYPA